MSKDKMTLGGIGKSLKENALKLKQNVGKLIQKEEPDSKKPTPVKLDNPFVRSQTAFNQKIGLIDFLSKWHDRKSINQNASNFSLIEDNIHTIDLAHQTVVRQMEGRNKFVQEYIRLSEAIHQICPDIKKFNKLNKNNKEQLLKLITTLNPGILIADVKSLGFYHISKAEEAVVRRLEEWDKRDLPLLEAEQKEIIAANEQIAEYLGETSYANNEETLESELDLKKYQKKVKSLDEDILILAEAISNHLLTMKPSYFVEEKEILQFHENIALLNQEVERIVSKRRHDLARYNDPLAAIQIPSETVRFHADITSARKMRENLNQVLKILFKKNDDPHTAILEAKEKLQEPESSKFPQPSLLIETSLEEMQPDIPFYSDIPLDISTNPENIATTSLDPVHTPDITQDAIQLDENIPPAMVMDPKSFADMTFAPVETPKLDDQLISNIPDNSPPNSNPIPEAPVVVDSLLEDERMAKRAQEKSFRKESPAVKIMELMLALIKTEMNRVGDTDERHSILDVLQKGLNHEVIQYTDLNIEIAPFVTNSIEKINSQITPDNLSKLSEKRGPFISFIRSLLTPINRLISLLGFQPFNPGFLSNPIGKQLQTEASKARNQLTLSLAEAENNASNSPGPPGQS